MRLGERISGLFGREIQSNNEFRRGDFITVTLDDGSSREGQVSKVLPDKRLEVGFLREDAGEGDKVITERDYDFIEVDSGKVAK